MVVQTTELKELETHFEKLLVHTGKFTKYLLSTYYVLGIILLIKDTAVNKPGENPCPH